MKIRKKLILAGFAILSLLITTVTTTFAWFSLNDAAWIGDFEMEIYSTDQLLVRHESGQFKQLLTQKDVVAAINDGRVFDKIDSLDDIKLSSVTSMDGESFISLVPKYDDMNRKTLEWKVADLNNYLEFKLVFKFDEAESKEGDIHPDYLLTIAENDEEGVKGTSFTSLDQTIKLVNSLNAQGKQYHMDDTITVNPVNAMRLSIIGDPEGSNSKVNYVYELGTESDLGSYAIAESILTRLEIGDAKYASGYNAAFTYFNNINSNLLKPMGIHEEFYELDVETENVKALLDKIRYNFNDDLGRFTYNEETKAYNDLSITIRLWLEGFDADNLIGLDASDIKCLFSFKVKEVVANE